MNRIREWLSLLLIDLGLWVMPDNELEALIRMSIGAGVDTYLEYYDNDES